MKKLESLNNSLFEKFEKNKINNLALCTGGEVFVTHGNLGSDTFNNIKDSGAVMYNPNKKANEKGDWYASGVGGNDGAGNASVGTGG